jgi:hypothetical protein
MTRDEFLTLRDTARRYRRTPRSIVNWLRADIKFPRPIRVPGGRLFLIAELIAWEAQRRESAS